MPEAASSPAATRSLLFVTTELAIGGTERHLAAVLPALAAAGHAVRLVALRGGPLAEVLRAGGVGVSLGRDMPGPLRALYGALLVAACILRDRPDVVHLFLPEAYLAGGLASLLPGRRHRVMSRRSLNAYQRGRPLAARLEHWLHRRMDAVLGNSRSVCRELAAEGAPRARIGLLRNGLAAPAASADRSAVRARLGLAPEAFVVLVVANLLPYKGHADLVRAVAQACGTLPRETVVLAAGADRGEAPVLRQLAEALGIGAQFRWLGQRDDVADLMRAADLLVHPAHQEGSPNVVLEAMAAGLPVIATDAGGTAELLDDAGLLVPPCAPDALAAALGRLAADAPLRAALSLKARARAADFSLEACVARYAALYAGLEAGRMPADLLPWEVA